MRRTFASSIVTIIVVAMLSTPSAKADVVAGNTFAIALLGAPDSLYAGEPLNLTLGIQIYDDGTSRRHPILVSYWTETPFGRAVLDTQTRRLMPGRAVKFSVAFAYNAGVRSPIYAGGASSYPVTIGVTVTHKGETLEASHEMMVLAGPTRE